jgi:hypothetical protein
VLKSPRFRAGTAQIRLTPRRNRGSKRRKRNTVRQERRMNTERREVKYLIPLTQYKKLEPKFRLVLQPDAAGDADGKYSVRSMYFDSLYNEDYLDVLKGAETRKKIRIRVYPPQGRVIKLEYKFKQGVNHRKTAIQLTRKQARQMLAGDYGFLMDLSDPLAADIYHEMTTRVYQPKVLIEYERQAFSTQGNDIRVTFDTGIRASWRNPSLFVANVNFTPLIPYDVGVLEVKYNGFLYTYLQNILRSLDGAPVAMSKYALGRADLQ